MFSARINQSKLMQGLYFIYFSYKSIKTRVKLMAFPAPRENVKIFVLISSLLRVEWIALASLPQSPPRPIKKRLARLIDLEKKINPRTFNARNLKKRPRNPFENSHSYYYFFHILNHPSGTHFGIVGKRFLEEIILDFFMAPRLEKARKNLEITSYQNVYLRGNSRYAH